MNKTKVLRVCDYDERTVAVGDLLHGASQDLARPGLGQTVHRDRHLFEVVTSKVKRPTTIAHLHHPRVVSALRCVP